MRFAPLLLCFLLLAARHAAADDDEDAYDDEPVQVTCGSLIKLQSDKTGHLLHSHEVAYGYGRGSGQQSVTAYPEHDSANSLWIVRSDGCRQGAPITNGQQVKLQHMATRRWLHSHLFHSPLSNNQEVSCFGDDSTTDTGDVWRVVWEAKGAQHWMRDATVKLVHVDTGANLGNHNVQYQRPIPGHTEVFAGKGKAGGATWRATEGVYFPQRGEAGASS